MSIISRMRKQFAVYWAPSGKDLAGQVTYAAPVEIACRWEKIQKEFMDSEGETRMSNGVVYVDREVQIKGYLMRGSLTTSVDTADPSANDDAWEVRQYEELPNLKASETLRTVYL